MSEHSISLALAFVPTLLVTLLALRAVRREPRRATNAVLCGVAVVMVMGTAVLTPSSGVLALGLVGLVLLSPLLGIGLVGALLLNGVLMVRREGRALGNMLSGLTGLALVGAVLASGWLALSTSGPLLGLSMWIVLTIAWLGFLFTCMVIYQWFYSALSGRQTRPDYVMALGSGLVRGEVGRLLGNRVRRAAEMVAYWNRSGAPPILVMSGGQGTDEPRPEAEAMADYAHRELAIPAQMIVREAASTTTEENLRFTSKLVREDARLGPASKGLAVTSNFHVLRAAELARRQGLDIQVTGAPVAWYYWPSAILREFVAQLLYHRVLFAVATALVTLPIPLLVTWATM